MTPEGDSGRTIGSPLSFCCVKLLSIYLDIINTPQTREGVFMTLEGLESQKDIRTQNQALDSNQN
jgi:hypothetical protein